MLLLLPAPLVLVLVLLLLLPLAVLLLLLPLAAPSAMICGARWQGVRVMRRRHHMPSGAAAQWLRGSVACGTAPGPRGRGHTLRPSYPVPKNTHEPKHTCVLFPTPPSPGSNTRRPRVHAHPLFIGPRHMTLPFTS